MSELLGRTVAVPTHEERMSLEELKKQLEAEVLDPEDNDAGLKAAYAKYAPVLQTMTERSQLYYKNRLAIKYGAQKIKDADTKALWVVMRKVLFALRSLGSQM